MLGEAKLGQIILQRMLVYVVLEQIILQRKPHSLAEQSTQNSSARLADGENTNYPPKPSFLY
jgi:hypothetical protein